MSERAASTVRRRSRGNSAGIDLRQIVKAARGLAPQSLTMQAVAKELGVDRSALNHHVSSREALLSLVATDSFTSSFDVEIPASADWREACRRYARAVSEGALAAGVLAEYLRLSGPSAEQVLSATEAVVQKLLDAGFSRQTAVRVLALLSTICIGHARDVAVAERMGERPRPAQLSAALREHGNGTYENLEQISLAPPDTYGAEQLDWSIDVFLRGVAELLEN